MAEPTALLTAVAAAQALDLIGLPEARLNLAQAVVALALAPKSNAVYLAHRRGPGRRAGRARRRRTAAPARRPLRRRQEARARRRPTSTLTTSRPGSPPSSTRRTLVAGKTYYRPGTPRSRGAPTASRSRRRSAATEARPGDVAD